MNVLLWGERGNECVALGRKGECVAVSGPTSPVWAKSAPWLLESSCLAVDDFLLY